MTGRTALPGWIMLEALLVLSIASLVAIPLGETVAAVVRQGAVAGHRLEVQTDRAVAAAAILRLTEEGYGPQEIVARLEPRFPSLNFYVEDQVCGVEDQSRGVEDQGRGVEGGE